MAPAPKTLVVLGAMGMQGSSVIDALLPTGRYHIRAVTRNVNSAKAQALKKRGVEVICANSNDASSLRNAFVSATAIFAMTDFWSIFSDLMVHANSRPGMDIGECAQDEELQHARNIIDAAASVDGPGLEHFIWSGLPSAKQWSRGKYAKVHHFEAKAQATEYIRTEHPKLWEKTDVMYLGQYLVNHLVLPAMQPRRRSGQHFELRLDCKPNSPWPYVSAGEDTGVVVKALLAKPPAPGKKFVACREYIGPGEFLAEWAEVLNVSAEYVHVSYEEMAGMESLGEEGAQAYAFVDEFGHEAREDPDVVYPHDLGLHLPSVREWIRNQDWSSILNAEVPSATAPENGAVSQVVV